jgi:hypothetical protein
MLELVMNKKAFDAIEKNWLLTVKARAMCPFTDASAVGTVGYISPRWYQTRGAVYYVNLAKPLTLVDIQEMIQIGSFVNRSFIISMAVVLEEYNIVPSGSAPDRTKNGGNHVQLIKWLRNRFAHGEWEYDANNPKHVETWNLLITLFPNRAMNNPNFDIPIDSVLESLKNGVLDYIREVT